MVAQFSLRLAGGPHAPAEARRYLRRLHGELGPDDLQLVTLLVSELITNSVRHAGADSKAEIVLDVELGETKIRVQVVDEGPGFTPLLTPPQPGTPGGVGLHILDDMADRWGVDATDRGTRVWFELDR